MMNDINGVKDIEFMMKSICGSFEIGWDVCIGEVFMIVIVSEFVNEVRELINRFNEYKYDGDLSIIVIGM